MKTYGFSRNDLKAIDNYIVEEYIMDLPIHIVAAEGYAFDAKRNILIVKTHNRGCDYKGGQHVN